METKITDNNKNKIYLESIKLLVPSFNKKLQIYININDTEKLETGYINFNKSPIDINITYQISSTFINKLSFTLKEKLGLFSHTILKGIVKSSEIMDNFINLKTYSCFLINSSNESIAVIYFSFDLHSEINTVDFFKSQLDTNKKYLNEASPNDVYKIESKDNNQTVSTFSKIKDLTKLSNAENMQKFIKNMIYLVTLRNNIINFLYWKSYGNTLKFLVVLSLIIYFPFYFVLIIPLLFIFFHFCFPDKFKKTLIFNKKKFNSLDGINFINFNVNAFNNIVAFIEDITFKLIEIKGITAEELYFEIIKLMFVLLLNYIVLFVFKIFKLINFRLLIIISLWIYTFSNNNKVKVCYYMISKIINKRILSPLKRTFELAFPRLNKYADNAFMNLDTMIKNAIPFYRIFQNIKYKRSNSIMHQHTLNIKNNEKENKDKSRKNYNANNNLVNEFFNNLKDVANENSYNKNNLYTNNNLFDINSSSIKYQIYENERWWMFVGWCKNLIMHEVPLWSDISMKRYMDKETVLLPNEEFKWDCNWEVEINEKTDELGWEYSNDFKSEYTSESFNKYVRRRKWIRLASKINNNNNKNEN